MVALMQQSENALAFFFLVQKKVAKSVNCGEVVGRLDLRALMSRRQDWWYDKTPPPYAETATD